MGAWGIGVFEDDSALDILDEFENFNLVEFIEEAFNFALETDYLDYDEGINVLVSAALIDFNLNKQKYQVLVDEYNNVVKAVKKLKLSQYKELACKALDVVISEYSELNELWSESEEYPKWKNNIENIKTRLKGAN